MMPPFFIVKEHVPYIIYWANGFQVIWGICLVMQPELANVAVLGGASILTDNGIEARLAGWLFLVVSSIAGFGIHLNGKQPENTAWLLALMPQYLIVIGASVTNLFIIVEGEYNDRSFDRFLLIALLGPLVLGGFYHTLGVLERFTLWKTLQSPLAVPLSQPPDS